ncbi:MULTISPECIES: MFS transporter [Cohnella]|uniref:MFS transporter n=1 Tax=Cohnella TaxID=329857 RepID=UPI0009BC07C7|nr:MULTISPECIES: MFS transporter [Cohnella]MBN2984109.1 MFS transporter [Cohnella algarum]
MKTEISSAMPPADAEPSLLREKVVVPLLGLILVLVIMNTMMFNLALPVVTEQFALSSSAASWIVTGYSIVFAISSITYSRLSDLVPIRYLLSFGLLCLGGASIAGFLSHDFVILLCARIVQAAGAGSVMSLAIVLISRYVPLSRRGKAMALISSAASLGLGLGPVVGGAITQFWGWNDLFLVTGCSLLLIPVVFRLLPEEPFVKGSFDWPGALLIGIGSTGLLLFLTGGSFVALAAGIVGLFAFWLRIRSAAEPFVQPALLRNKRYLLLGSLGLFAYINSFALLFLLPQLLAHLYGLKPGISGLIVFPGAFVSMLASNAIGKGIDRYGNGLLLRVAPWPIAVSGLLFALFADQSYFAVMFIYMLMIVGFSALNASVSNEMSRILPAANIGAGMGLFQLIQFFSGAFSVAVCGSFLAARERFPLADTYALIFWGLMGIGLLSVLCSFVYLGSNRGSRADGVAG